MTMRCETRLDVFVTCCVLTSSVILPTSTCGFYSLARSHQTTPKLRTTRNKLCQKPKLPTDLSCPLYLKSFLNLKSLQDQVGCYFRNKTKGEGGTFQLLLCVSCVRSFPALLLTLSQAVFQKSISWTAHLSHRGNCFLSWFRFQMYTKEVTLIL
uniref:Uncharacterized protein n=1 Tax=Pipistrellus kuhlii TaxID=59472 RepID=A0A7J7TP66_PIPKU|nr:hypothetical protein mPipKuh1_009294 [Pipistrellus kuhlii]